MKYLLITVFLLTSYNSFAQVQFTLKSFEEDKLIKSLDDVLYIVRQEYAVRGPDSLLYGDNNKDYFGVGYSPAVMVEGNLILNKYGYYPYLRDTSFRRLGENYVPEPTKTVYKGIRDSVYAPLEAGSVIDGKYSVQIPTGDSVSIKNKIPIKVAGKMDCVVITVFSPDSALSEDSIFDYSFVNTTVTWKSDGTGTIKEQELGEDIKFGLLFYERTGYGNAALIPGGLVERNYNNNWRAVKIELPQVKEKKETENDN